MQVVGDRYPAELCRSVPYVVWPFAGMLVTLRLRQYELCKSLSISHATYIQLAWVQFTHGLSLKKKEEEEKRDVIPFTPTSRFTFNFTISPGCCQYFIKNIDPESHVLVELDKSRFHALTYCLTERSE